MLHWKGAEPKKRFRRVRLLACFHFEVKGSMKNKRLGLEILSRNREHQKVGITINFQARSLKSLKMKLLIKIFQYRQMSRSVCDAF